jgi:hypothetical protein
MHNPNESNIDNDAILEAIGGERLIGSGFETEIPDAGFPSHEYSGERLER